MRSKNENFDVFNSRDKYIWYLLKKVNVFFILYFLGDLQLINLLTTLQAESQYVEDKGVFVTEYLDQST